MFKSILCAIFLITTWNIISEAVGVTTDECSQSYLGRAGHGIITSYNYPFDYLHNLTCTYSIHVTSDLETTNVVCFTFHRFSLESSTPFCSFDYLKLEYPNLKYCAQGLWMYGVQTANSVSNVWSKDFCWTVKNTKTFDVTFSSDNNINGAGFYAEFFIYPGVDNERILPPGNLGQAPCAADEWTCFNRRCVDDTLLCDGIDQCGDGSDESYAHARCGEQNVLACDFTSGTVSDGYCGFTHEGWYRTKEQHSPYGPPGDHTNGSSGFYVYSDVNQSSAFLLGPELSLPRNKTYCLSFWYYIYGRPAAALLRVYVTRDQAYSRPEWSRSEAPENQWIKGEISIHSEADIQVIFAAELDNSFSGVALDDLSILPGSCLGGDLSCNFESGTCGWNVTSDIVHSDGTLHGDLRWTLHSRLLGPTGPAWDHSSKDGGGYYLYLNNTSPLGRDNLALLVSAPISAFPLQYKCAHFWYHMNGQDKDCCQLKVKVHKADNTLTDVVWEKTGDVRSAWKEAFVNLNMREPFQLVIEGMISADSRSQIAIDAIILSDGLCSGTGGGACEIGQYLCGDGQCINATRKCDGKQDCLDLSDEDWRAGCVTTVATTTTTLAPIKPQPTCSPGQFQCHGDGRCIHGDWVCDKYDDCSDRSDETSLAGCSGTGTGLQPCNGDWFLCRNGRCIHGNNKCDYYDNCGDNSDEKNCTVAVPTVAVPSVCAETEFSCHDDHMCIPRSMVCDKKQDCSDKSDESEEFADCQIAVITYTSVTLGAGAISGIAIGCLLCAGLIILSALLGRKRRKPQPRRHRHSQRGGEISTISEPSTMDRNISMLEAIRPPVRSLSGLPPYSEQNLENMGYSSDGTATLGRGGGPAAIVFPPEEPPPPYDSVIKENEDENGARVASGVNTPDSTPGPSASSGQTPEDDSYGFRSRSRPGSARSARRKSRERTPTRYQGAGQYDERSVDLPPPVITPDHSTGTPTDDRENIYEELFVPTLRPNQLRSEPSSSSTLQQAVPVSSPQLSPAAYSYGQAGHPEAVPSSSPQISPAGYGYGQAGHPEAVPSSSPQISPAAYGYGQGGNTEAVTASVHPPPTRTMPHQRIRLGTQSLHNRPVTATYRPKNYYNDQGNTVVNSTPGHRGVGYEPLDPPGPYSIRPNPYDSIPSPTHTSTPVTGNTDVDEPAINTPGRHSQRYQRRADPEQSAHRLYGSHRNPPRNYGANTAGRIPYQSNAPRDQTRSKQPQTQANQPQIRANQAQIRANQPQIRSNQPQTQAPRPQTYAPRAHAYTARAPDMRAGSLSPRVMPSPALSPRAINPALSPRAMPSPKTHTNRAPQASGAPHVQLENYIYRPRTGEPTDISNRDQDQSGTSNDTAHPRTIPNHTRDWNNSSFASAGSQEQLIGSPPGAISQYPHHPRADSNISSDIDSTSPLVASREDTGTELEILTPTAV